VAEIRISNPHLNKAAILRQHVKMQREYTSKVTTGKQNNKTNETIQQIEIYQNVVQWHNNHLKADEIGRTTTLQP
jgi:hypothetical protein